jgi:hypothetical protein
MTVVNTHTLIVAVWLLASGLVAAFAAPLGIEATALLIVISGLSVLGSLLGKDTAPTPVFDGVPAMTALPRPEPSAARLLEWPNSGFRNITRSAKRG